MTSKQMWALTLVMGGGIVAGLVAVRGDDRVAESLVVPARSPAAQSAEVLRRSDFSEVAVVRNSWKQGRLWQASGRNPLMVKRIPSASLLAFDGVAAWQAGETVALKLGGGLAEIPGRVKMNVIRPDGARAVRLAVDPDASGIGGDFFGVCLLDGGFQGFLRIDNERGVYTLKAASGELVVERIPLDQLICTTASSVTGGLAHAGVLKADVLVCAGDDDDCELHVAVPRSAELLALAASRPASQVRMINYTPAVVLGEPSAGLTRNYTLRFTVSPLPVSDVTFNYNYVSNSALKGKDFLAKSGLAKIRKGVATFDLSVSILGDSKLEGEEAFNVRFSNLPSGYKAGLITVGISADAKSPKIPTGESAAQGSIPIWSSKPVATNLVYLDFDGAVLKGTAWNDDGESVVSESVALKFGNSGMAKIWNMVADAYAVFNINVTTDKALFLATSAASKTWMLFTPEAAKLGIGNAAGIAFLGSFGNAGFQPGLVFTNWTSNTTFMGVVASHESGHTFGLNHDGRISPTIEYYSGHGDDDYGWGPWMGTPYFTDFRQWSAGGYYKSSNNQNDLTTISKLTGMVPDESGTTPGSALSLTFGLPFSGVISSSGDKDYFSVLMGLEGSVRITLSQSTSSDSSLCPSLRILTSSGALLVATDDPGWKVNAALMEWSGNLPAGVTVFEVDGIGHGNPLVAASKDYPLGFNDYGSVGKYTLNLISD